LAACACWITDGEKSTAAIITKTTKGIHAIFVQMFLNMAASVYIQQLHRASSAQTGTIIQLHSYSHYPNWRQFSTSS
jgi:hypothetical protein